MITSAPLHTVDPGQCRQTPTSGTTVECGVCEKIFCAAAVTNGRINFDPITFRFSRSRRLYCDHCNHIQHWIQRCDVAGVFIS